VVIGYERKRFIRLKECFKVSKTKDHYQQFDYWHHSYFLLPLFFDLPFFFIALPKYTHFILVITFHVIWVCPLAFEFLGLFMPFWLSHGFFSFLIEIFSCPLVWGMILVGICFHERKIIQAQKGIARDVLISESERNNKDGLSSFQAQAVKINKLWTHPVWWFGLCKDAFHRSWATSSLHTIIHTFKNTWFKSRGVRVFIHFSFFII